MARRPGRAGVPVSRCGGRAAIAAAAGGGDASPPLLPCSLSEGEPHARTSRGSLRRRHAEIPRARLSARLTRAARGRRVRVCSRATCQSRLSCLVPSRSYRPYLGTLPYPPLAAAAPERGRGRSRHRRSGARTRSASWPQPRRSCACARHVFILFLILLLVLYVPSARRVWRGGSRGARRLSRARRALPALPAGRRGPGERCRRTAPPRRARAVAGNSCSCCGRGRRRQSQRRRAEWLPALAWARARQARGRAWRRCPARLAPRH